MNKPSVGRGGKWSERVPFRILVLQEAAAAAKFNQHITETSGTPALKVADDLDPDNLSEGFIKRIHFRIKDAAGDSYTLRFWRVANDGSTIPYQLQMNKLWESPALRLSDEEYDFNDLDIPFKLHGTADLFYGLEWTSGAAPAGNVQGYIEISGETIK